ncbi:MAG: hypothetical protein Q9219_005839 [cf. Caloplaca sp. 3 TL-2023]
MKYALALASLAAAVSAQNPPGCSSNSDGTFVIQPLNITNSPGQFDKVGLQAVLTQIVRRQVRTVCGATPIVTLQDGVLKDQDGRTGSVVANSQFQFDNPIQSGAIFVDGFSICSNGSLAVGGSTVFYQCLSGTFYNLYQQSQGKQCNEIYINTIPCESNGSNPASSASSGSTASAPTTPSTPAATPATSAAAPPAVTPTTVAAPYPVGNGTAPGPTGTASGAGGSTTSATSSPSPSAFTSGSGASTIVIGGKLIAVAAGIAALAMF